MLEDTTDIEWLLFHIYEPILELVGTSSVEFNLDEKSFQTLTRLKWRS